VEFEGHVVTFVLIAVLLHISGVYLWNWVTVLVGAVVTVLPDIDLKFKSIIPHRTFTHSPTFLVFMIIGAYYLTLGTDLFISVFAGIILGFMIHIGGDGI